MSSVYCVEFSTRKNLIMYPVIVYNLRDEIPNVLLLLIHYLATNTIINQNCILSPFHVRLTIIFSVPDSQGVGHNDDKVLVLAATNTPYALDQVTKNLPNTPS